MNNTEIDSHIKEVSNIINYPYNARKLYFEYLSDEYDISSIIEDTKIAHHKTTNINKEYVDIDLCSHDLFTKGDETINYIQNKTNIEPDFIINNLGINLMMIMAKEINQSKEFKDKLYSKTNGIYIGLSRDYIYNAKVILSSNNEHLILLNPGLTHTCYFLSHLSLANQKISTPNDSENNENKFTNNELINHTNSFFRHLIRYGSKYNFSKLKLSEHATKIMIDLTSSAEKFIIKHEYAHILNGDFENNNKNRKTDEDKELLADALAINLVLLPYIDKDELDENDIYELSIDIAGIYISLLANYIIMEGLPNQDNSYYLKALHRWELIKEILNNTISTEFFKFQNTFEKHLQPFLDRILLLLISLDDTIQYGKNNFNDNQNDKVLSFLNTLDNNKRELLVSIIKSSPNNYNEALFSEVLFLLNLIDHEGNAITKAYSYYISNEIDRAKLLLFLLEEKYNNWSIYYTFSSIYMSQNEYNTALLYLKNIESFNIEYSYVETDKAICYKELKRYKEAEKAFLNAIKYEPITAEWYKNLALFYDLEVNKKAKAKANYKKAIELNELYGFSDLQSLNNYATILIEENNLLDAKKLFESIMELDSSHQFTMINLIDIYVKDNEFKKIIEIFKRHIITSSDYEKRIFYYFNLIKDTISFNKYFDDIIQLVVDSNKDNAEFYFMIGEFCEFELLNLSYSGINYSKAINSSGYDCDMYIDYAIFIKNHWDKLSTEAKNTMLITIPLKRIKTKKELLLHLTKRAIFLDRTSQRAHAVYLDVVKRD